jgi:hypothetical protein
MKPRYKWCEQKEEFVDEPPSNRQVKTPRIRCPHCRKLLTLKTRNVEPFGTFFKVGWFIPKHKRRMKSSEYKPRRNHAPQGTPQSC